MNNTEKKPMNVSSTLLNQLYNQKIKEAFLQDYLEEDSTRTSYSIFLIMASRWENKIGKDLFEFSREDVLDICSDNFTDSYSSLRAFYTICTLYVGYCTQKGYNKTMINSWKLVKFNQHIMPMLNALHLPTKYLSEEQVWAIEDESMNYNDYLPLVLAYHGIKGTKNSEIVKLQDEDVNTITNTLTLTDEDGSVREVEISQRLMRIVALARGESVYQRRGKEGFGGRNSCTLKEDSNFVLRPTTINGGSGITPQTASARVKKLLADCGHGNLSIIDIYTSGKLNMLKEIEKQNGKLEVEDFKKVQFEFNDDTKNYSNLMIQYNLVNPKAE